MKKSLLIVLMALILTNVGSAQINGNEFEVYDGKGRQSNLNEIVKVLGKYDVVFLGETHNDKVAHALQLEIFTKAIEKYGEKRKVVLSLEMFERDVQVVLDEYLLDLISEKHFLASSRPWENYEADYRPLVELAKQNKLDVVAANAPRRYVNMVSRFGKESLSRLSPDALKWLAPLPFADSSEPYTEKFNALMGGHGNENILASQTLWDATMAHSIYEKLRIKQKHLVVHLNGSFHTENRLGTVEQLLKYHPKSKVLVVTMKPVDDVKLFDSETHAKLGDFVILTKSAETVN